MPSQADRYELEERAAILEYEAGFDRAVAERVVFGTPRPPAGDAQGDLFPASGSLVRPTPRRTAGS